MNRKGGQNVASRSKRKSHRREPAAARRKMIDFILGILQSVLSGLIIAGILKLLDW